MLVDVGFHFVHSSWFFWINLQIRWASTRSFLPLTSPILFFRCKAETTYTSKLYLGKDSYSCQLYLPVFSMATTTCCPASFLKKPWIAFTWLAIVKCSSEPSFCRQISNVLLLISMPIMIFFINWYWKNVNEKFIN